MPSCHEETPKSHDPAQQHGDHGDHCHPEKTNFDWLLWGSATCILGLYSLHALWPGELQADWLATGAQAAFDVGALGRIPQAFVTAALGQGGTWKGLWRATLAGLALDLCSHGILMVGMQLYRQGASLGQVMAFLIASPWNSLSLTIILIALIGLPWALTFIVLSMLIAIISGRLFDLLVQSGKLPAGPRQEAAAADFRFWREARTSLAGLSITPALVGEVLWEGLKGSRMVLRWLLFGVLLAASIRAFIDMDTYQVLFGPTLAGLGLTLLAATIIEVCSEGSAPIAADLLTRGGAPGNSFGFLMTGVSTDYTEIMSIKDTTGSWKIALFLPLITLPQVVIIAWLLNQSV